MRRGLVLGCGGPVGFAWTALALSFALEAAREHLPARIDRILEQA